MKKKNQEGGEELAHIIKTFRRRYALTQGELGEEVGVSRRTIAAWETGDRGNVSVKLVKRALRDLARELEERAVVGEGA